MNGQEFCKWLEALPSKGYYVQIMNFACALMVKVSGTDTRCFKNRSESKTCEHLSEHEFKTCRLSRDVDRGNMKQGVITR